MRAVLVYLGNDVIETDTGSRQSCTSSMRCLPACYPREVMHAILDLHMCRIDGHDSEFTHDHCHIKLRHVMSTQIHTLSYQICVGSQCL